MKNKSIQDLGSLTGVDGQVYACQEGDIVSLPEPNAVVLIEHEQAVPVGGS